MRMMRKNDEKESKSGYSSKFSYHIDELLRRLVSRDLLQDNHICKVLRGPILMEGKPPAKAS